MQQNIQSSKLLKETVDHQNQSQIASVGWAAELHGYSWSVMVHIVDVPSRVCTRFSVVL